jgi:hypothetical protein
MLRILEIEWSSNKRLMVEPQDILPGERFALDTRSPSGRRAAFYYEKNEKPYITGKSEYQL